MLPNELELLLLAEIDKGRALDGLMDRVFHEDEPDDARQALKRIANQFSLELPDSLDAFHYYQGMRVALNEEDFRWAAFQPFTPAALRQLRRNRLTQYKRHLELFELEIELARALRRSAAALRNNWSSMESDFLDGLQIAKYRFWLRFAAVLYRFRIPGAIDLCDAAVFEIIRMAYLRPSPAA